MSEERDRILRMVENGAINAEEAANLMASIEGDEEDRLAADGQLLPPPGGPPWEAPLIAGTILSGFGLLGLIRGTRAGVLGRIGAWATLLLGLLAIVVGVWSRNAPWLHVRVQEKDGQIVRVSLPIPLPLASQILTLARGFVDDETASYLDSAAAFINGLQRGEQQDPLRIEVDDGDGTQVQVYIA
jgi:hypothetical protein